MKLDESNLKVFKDERGHSLKIIMPDGSDNYLHLESYNDIDSILLIRDLLSGQYLLSSHLSVQEDGTYYRISLKIRDENNNEYFFHSRKLNLNDVVFERMLLIQ